MSDDLTEHPLYRKESFGEEIARLQSELDAAIKRAEEFERQLDCSHQKISYGICDDCGFDYRRHDCDDAKCKKCGSWALSRQICERCMPQVAELLSRVEEK